MAFEKGIDVAKWNGTINWPNVKRAGIDFAILKVTIKSNAKEPTFDRNFEGCTNNNIKIGGYRYVYATTVDAARKEAEGVLAALNGRKLPYGMWLDMEDASIKGLGKSMLNKIIDTEAEIYRSAGYGVGIYCNRDWYQNVLDTNYLTQHYIFWMADYGKNNGTYTDDKLEKVRGYKNVIGWQYTSKAVVDGITGVVDGDVTFGDWDFLVGYYGGAKKTDVVMENAGNCYPAYKGDSIHVDVVLAEIGVPKAYYGSYTKRSKIARINGIVNYRGTTAENLKLIELAKAGKLIRI